MSECLNFWVLSQLLVVSTFTRGGGTVRIDFEEGQGWRGYLPEMEMVEPARRKTADGDPTAEGGL